jgi:hypothetical protein
MGTSESTGNTRDDYVNERLFNIGDIVIHEGVERIVTHGVYQKDARMIYVRKDELQRIEYFQNNLGTNANAAKAKQALKCIKGLETRKYKPRKYEELFENCVLKDRRLQREDIYETVYNSQNTKQRYSIEPTFNDKGGEETMVQERNYTPFDGKENDWVSFAKQQA